MTQDGSEIVVKTKIDRRRLMRVQVDFVGRLFVPTDGREAACRIVDMSSTGAQIACEFMPESETGIVLYIDGFGRFEAVVARASEKGFAVRFNCSALKRERVAEQLASFVNRGAVDATALRRHERTDTQGLAKFARANGDVVACEVLDLSLGGLSLKTEARPPVGEIVSIGQMSGRVVRYHESGIAIEFLGAPAERDGTERSLRAIPGAR